MVDITAVDGTVIHADDNSVVVVVGPLPGDPPNRCYITGPASGEIPTNEAAAAFLARLHPKHPLAQFTRPDGSPVWIAAAAVTSLRIPLPVDIPPGEQVGAVVFVGGHRQVVEKSVGTVRAITNQLGGNV